MADHPDTPRTWQEVAAGDPASIALLRLKEAAGLIEQVREQLRELKARDKDK